MKETQSDFVFLFRRNSSRYSFSQDRKGDSRSNVQLKRASWSSFPHLMLCPTEENTQIMEAKTSPKCRSSENLKKPHKLVKSKSTSFFKTTSSFKNFFASAFSSTHSSSAASVVSATSSASTCSSSSIPSSPKIRSSWSSGVTHILERERCNNYKDDNYEIVGTVPPPFSNGLHTRNGSVHVTASLLEEEEEDDEMIMNTPKIICAHKKTPDVERKTRRQIAQELELMRQLGKLPGDGGGRPETYEDKNFGSYYENFLHVSNLKGYKPTQDVENHNETIEETLNKINLKNSGLYANNAADDNAHLYSDKINCFIGRSKSLNITSENKSKSVQRISLSTPQEGASDKIESIAEPYQDTITYNPLVNQESNVSQNIPVNKSERNVIFDMLNYTGVTDLTDDEDSDYDSSDVMMNIDDESSCFEKCLEDNLEKLCDKENYSRENSTFSVYSLKENFSLDNPEEVSIDKESSKDPLGLEAQTVIDQALEGGVGQTQQSDINSNDSQNLVNSFNELNNEGSSAIESLRTDKFLSETDYTKCSTNESDIPVQSKTCDAKDAADEGKVQLRKKHRPNLQLDLGKTQVHKVLSNEKVLRRIAENEIDFGAKSPKTPKSPAIDIDECFKERQQKLKDSPKDNLTKVKDLTQRLRLPLERPTYLQWLNIPNKESAEKLAEVISPPVSVIVEGQFILRDNAVQATEAQRSKNITNALLWIKDELVKMKQQDQQLASQLVHLQLEMQRMRLVRSCTQHEALLEEVTCEEEEQKAYMTSADLYDPPNSHRECAPSILRNIGVTRMNIASRRFTLR